MKLKRAAVVLALVGVLSIVVGLMVGGGKVESTSGIPCGSYFAADEDASSKEITERLELMYEMFGDSNSLDALAVEGVRRESQYLAECKDARDSRAIAVWVLVGVGIMLLAAAAAVAVAGGRGGEQREAGALDSAAP